MTCSAGGTVNEQGRKFCGECGARLLAACPSCGSGNAPTARFCGECGNPMGSPGTLGASGSAAPATTGPRVRARAGSSEASPPGRPEPIAERRLVSVLFADLVGFTALAEGRDPEAVRELLGGYFEQASETIERYRGTVEQL